MPYKSVVPGSVSLALSVRVVKIIDAKRLLDRSAKVSFTITKTRQDFHNEIDDFLISGNMIGTLLDGNRFSFDDVFINVDDDDFREILIDMQNALSIIRDDSATKQRDKSTTTNSSAFDDAKKAFNALQKSLLQWINNVHNLMTQDKFENNFKLSWSNAIGDQVITIVTNQNAKLNAEQTQIMVDAASKFNLIEDPTAGDLENLYSTVKSVAQKIEGIPNVALLDTNCIRNDNRKLNPDLKKKSKGFVNTFLNIAKTTVNTVKFIIDAAEITGEVMSWLLLLTKQTVDGKEILTVVTLNDYKVNEQIRKDLIDNVVSYLNVDKPSTLDVANLLTHFNDKMEKVTSTPFQDLADYNAKFSKQLPDDVKHVIEAALSTLITTQTGGCSLAVSTINLMKAVDCFNRWVLQEATFADDSQSNDGFVGL